MERRPAKLTVFDVDGTLLPDNPDEISGRAFWELNKRGIFTSSDEKLQELWDLREEYIHNANFNRRDYLTPMIIEFDEQIKGKPLKVIRPIAEELAERDFGELLRPQMIEEINYQREDGAKLGIISGSPDVFIQPFAYRAGFDYATGTRHYEDGKVFHHFKKASSRAADKERIAHNWRDNISKEVGKTTLLWAAYGDTMNDASLLEHAQHAVAVNPKKDLAKYAIENGWRTIQAKEANLEFQLDQPVEKWYHDKYDLTDSHAV